MRYFDGKTYKWVGLSRQPNIMGRVCFSDFDCCFVVTLFLNLCFQYSIEIEVTLTCMILFLCVLAQKTNRCLLIIAVNQFSSDSDAITSMITSS